MIWEEVCELINKSRKYGHVIPELNETFLTLIPKEEWVTHPKKLWPIDLCNVIYKILTKVIAHRLKPLLPFIISPKQLGYVEGRKIIDSVTLDLEGIHSLQITGILGMLLNLYLSKYFDKLSCAYMQYTLLDFGFSPA